MTPRRSVPAVVALALLAVCLLVGCGRDPQGKTIGYYLGSTEDLDHMNTVAFVALDDQGKHVDISELLTEELAQSIQDRKFFCIRVLRQDDPACEDLPLSKPEGLSLQDMARIQQALHCDGILYGRLTRFQSYPRMTVGLFLSLVDLRQGECVWGVEHVWDSTDKAVEKRLKKFFRTQQRSGYAPADWELGMLSPRMFLKFVAYEASGTLKAPPEQGVLAGLFCLGEGH